MSAEGLIPAGGDGSSGASAANAGLGKIDQAINQFQQALDHGWNEVGEVDGCAELVVLHDHPKWPDMMAHLERNVQAAADAA